MLLGTSIYIIGVCFGTENVSGMIDVADKFCKKNFPGSDVVNLVVDNSLDTEVCENFPEYRYISGDNNNMEFSGWQHGINFIKKHYHPSHQDVCILVNDTVHRRNYAVGGDRYFDYFCLPQLSAVRPQYWAAGYLDDFPSETSIYGLRVKTWIRSNFIVFNFGCFDFINPLVFPFSEEFLFCTNVSDGFWKEDAPLSENWKAYISSWLFGEEDPKFPEYRLKWIKCKALSKDNFGFFRKKAISILSEHYLTARLLNMNTEIYDFNIFPKNVDRHIMPYYR